MRPDKCMQRSEHDQDGMENMGDQDSPDVPDVLGRSF